MALHIIKTTDVTKTLDVYDSDLKIIVGYLGKQPTHVSVDSTETEEFWETSEIEGFKCDTTVYNEAALFLGRITVNGVTYKAVAMQEACPMAVMF